MHIDFNPNTINWQLFVLANNGAPSNTLVDDEGNNTQFGAGAASSYAIFRGMPLQRGTGIGSVFRSLFMRYLLPIGKQIGIALGREGLETGVRVLGDVVDGRSVKQAAVEHGKAAAHRLLKQAEQRLQQQQQQATPSQMGSGLQPSSRKHINRGLRNALSHSTASHSAFSDSANALNNNLLPASDTTPTHLNSNNRKRKKSSSATNSKAKKSKTAYRRRRFRRPLRKKKTGKRRKRQSQASRLRRTGGQTRRRRDALGFF